MSPFPPVHRPSPPSSSSSLELLAFSYDHPSPHGEYPNDNQSQPVTPASASVRSRDANSDVNDEESLLITTRSGAKGDADDTDMEPFEKGEWVLISTSSMLVAALIVASILMMLGKVSL